jgi:hypothetical protein
MELAHFDFGPVAHGVPFRALAVEAGQGGQLLPHPRFGQSELGAAPVEGSLERKLKGFHG